MPACTACGNHLSTDYLRVFGGNDGALESCPHCAAGRDDAGRPAMTIEPAGPTAGNGDTTAKRSLSAGSTDTGSPDPDRSRGAGSPRAEGPTDAESPDDGESEFTVKTAGRSLEPPRESAGVERSRTERSHPIRDPDRDRPPRERDRTPSVLSSVLDVFR